MGKKTSHQETRKEKIDGFNHVKIKSVFQWERQYGYSEQWDILKNKKTGRIYLQYITHSGS